MWKLFVSITIFVLVGTFAFGFDQDDVGSRFRHGLQIYIKTDIRTADFNRSIQNLHLPNLFSPKQKFIIPTVACLACNVLLDVLLEARRQGVPKERLVKVVEDVCVWLQISSRPVCHGTIKLQADHITYIIDNKKDLTAARMCSIVLQNFDCKDPDRIDWTIDIPPPTTPPKKKPLSGLKPLKVLHLTDIHYDPNYSVSSNGACGDPLCCQNGSLPTNATGAAGYWGDYRDCDLPWYTITNSLNHIVTQHGNLDFVYFTGDVVSHKVWDTDVTRNTEGIKKITKELKISFQNTPVYPVLGNHEAHPVNLFTSEGIHQPNLTTQWVFDLVAEEWKVWLPADTRDTIVQGGFYTSLIKPGFRIVGLNSNLCYTMNWWLIYDDFDPNGQLQWLVSVLLDAERNNEVVHIIAHMSNGEDNCLNNWSREYARIVNRFSHIIAAQFNGHTHYDRTIVFFNIENPSQAINVGFDGGSLTSYSDLNPNYKVFHVDPQNAAVIDYESWSFNLTKANLTPHISPNWFKLYSFKEAYGVENLSPTTLAALTEKMAKTPLLTELYFRFKNREADTALTKGCNKNCEIRNLCEMVTSYSDDKLHCEILTDIYNSARS